MQPIEEQTDLILGFVWSHQREGCSTSDQQSLGVSKPCYVKPIILRQNTDRR